MAGSNSKGKGRAASESDHNNNNSSEPSSEQSPLIPSDPSSTKPTISRRAPKLSHGRGPLIVESDEEDSVSHHQGGHTSSLRSASHSRSSPGTKVFLSACGSVLFLLLLAVAVVHVWLGHVLAEEARTGSIEDMGRRGLLVNGPSAVRVREDEGRMVVDLDGEIGVDARKGLGWESKDTSGWLKRTEGGIARWAISRVERVSVQLGQISIMDLKRGNELVIIQSLQKLLVPVSYPTVNGTPPALQQTTLSIPLDFPSPTAVADFIRRSWNSKRYAIQVKIEKLSILPGGSLGAFGSFVKKMGKLHVKDLSHSFEGEVPDDDLPTDPASLVKLNDFDIFPSTSPISNASVVSLFASASLQNPLHKSTILGGRLSRVDWSIPYQLPATISLPGDEFEGDEEVLLAKAVTSPFGFLSGEKATNLTVRGQLVSLGKAKSSTAAAISTAMSKFMANYLAGKDNTILVRYDPSPLPSNSTAPFPPTFLTPLLSNITVPLTMPGSSGKVELFRNLRIEDMKIRLSSLLQQEESPEGDLYCSGKVVGEMLLPEQFAGLLSAIEVKAIWPDVYVYDGDVPPPRISSSYNDPFASLAQISLAPPTSKFNTAVPSYPPVPTPATAFARLHPGAFIDASTTHYPANATHASITLISATFIDAPLYLLPERGDVFRRFISKILFGGSGAKVRAGVKGITKVRVELGGWGSIDLDNLPIEGNFNVGRDGVNSLGKQ